MDFTIKKYIEFLAVLKSYNYKVYPLKEINANTDRESGVILRHDVDKKPQNSLKFAKIQRDMGFTGSYYFRIVPESWDEKIIKEISDLGHEIGYHYETMDTSNGNVDLAWDQFRINLDKFRSIVDVETICMHGSPLSKFDNKDLWNKFSYKSLGIKVEPYYDIDYSKYFYLTDTGRCWDGWKFSVRDKMMQQEKWIEKGMIFHSTDDVIATLKNKKINNILFTFHPQRWSNNIINWSLEFISQNIKNIIKKKFFVK